MEWRAIRNNLTEVTRAVADNLELFATELPKRNFISTRATKNVLSVQKSVDLKANDFMTSIEAKINSRFGNYENWFENFMLIFVESQISEDVAQKVFSDYGM